MALQFVLQEADKELKRPVDPSSEITTSPNTQRRRKSTVGQLSRRRRSSGQFEDDIEPEQQLLRNMGISLPDVTNDEARVDIFERALSDRLGKLRGHALNLQTTTESSISSHLLDAHLTLQLLQDSLLAATPYKSVKMVDPEITNGLGYFERELEEMREKVEGVDLQQKLHVRNVHKENLIERWAR